MKETIPIKIEKLNLSFTIQLKWFIYLPFIGWLYPFIWENEDEYAMHHARQGFIAAVIFAVLPTIITFIAVFIPNTSRIVRLVAVALIYLSHITYFTLCIVGTIMVVRNKKWDIPFVKNYAAKLNI